MGMSPWSSEVVSKTKQLPSPAGKKENCAIPPRFPWVPWGLTHGEANHKCRTRTIYRILTKARATKKLHIEHKKKPNCKANNKMALLHDSLYGCRGKRSTEHALIDTVNRIQSHFDKLKECFLVVYSLI